MESHPTLTKGFPLPPATLDLTIREGERKSKRNHGDRHVCPTQLAFVHKRRTASHLSVFSWGKLYKVERGLWEGGSQLK